MFGEEAEALLRSVRARHSGETSLLAGDVDATRGERIRELVKIVQETGVGEIEIEDAGMRVSVRRADEAPTAQMVTPVAQAAASAAGDSAASGLVAVESPMVGTFYRAPQPGAPAFVEVGDNVLTGQTLCILEAMKLMNEVKAESGGIVRAVHVDNAQAVEFGQVLFELEPATSPPAV